MKRLLDELFIYRLNKYSEYLMREELINIYMDKMPETIYVIWNDKLFGIITLGDVLKACNGNVKINRTFTKLEDWNIIRARQIFLERKNIYTIPVIDGEGKLLGSHTSWNEELFLKRQNWNENFRIELFSYINKNNYFLWESFKWQNWFLDSHIYKDREIGKAEGRHLSEIADTSLKVISIDEEEKRGLLCLCALKGWKFHVYSFAEIIRKYEHDKEVGDVCSGTDDKSIDYELTYVLKNLVGVSVYTFGECITDSVWAKEYDEAKKERNEKVKVVNQSVFPAKEYQKEFFEELYDEGYSQSLINYEYKQKSISGVTYLEDFESKYLNVRQGCRKTCYQPENYDKTVYFFGPCVVVGWSVEDKHTIESFLQRKIVWGGVFCKSS